MAALAHSSLWCSLSSSDPDITSLAPLYPEVLEQKARDCRERLIYLSDLLAGFEAGKTYMLGECTVEVMDPEYDTDYRYACRVKHRDGKWYYAGTKTRHTAALWLVGPWDLKIRSAYEENLLKGVYEKIDGVYHSSLGGFTRDIPLSADRLLREDVPFTEEELERQRGARTLYDAVLSVLRKRIFGIPDFRPKGVGYDEHSVLNYINRHPNRSKMREACMPGSCPRAEGRGYGTFCNGNCKLKEGETPVPNYYGETGYGHVWTMNCFVSEARKMMRLEEKRRKEERARMEESRLRREAECEAEQRRVEEERRAREEQDRRRREEEARRREAERIKREQERVQREAEARRGREEATGNHLFARFAGLDVDMSQAPTSRSAYEERERRRQEAQEHNKEVLRKWRNRHKAREEREKKRRPSPVQPKAEADRFANLDVDWELEHPEDDDGVGVAHTEGDHVGDSGLPSPLVPSGDGGALDVVRDEGRPPRALSESEKRTRDIWRNRHRKKAPAGSAPRSKGRFENLDVDWSSQEEGDVQGRADDGAPPAGGLDSGGADLGGGDVRPHSDRAGLRSAGSQGDAGPGRLSETARKVKEAWRNRHKKKPTSRLTSKPQDRFAALEMYDEPPARKAPAQAPSRPAAPPPAPEPPDPMSDGEYHALQIGGDAGSYNNLERGSEAYRQHHTDRRSRYLAERRRRQGEEAPIIDLRPSADGTTFESEDGDVDTSVDDAMKEIDALDALFP